MATKNVHISDDFKEVTTRTIDSRQRVCVGDMLKGLKRLQILRNKTGEILLRPLAEVPASEAWLFRNKKALSSVKKGLEDAQERKISKLNPKDLA